MLRYRESRPRRCPRGSCAVWKRYETRPGPSRSFARRREPNRLVRSTAMRRDGTWTSQHTLAGLLLHSLTDPGFQLFGKGESLGDDGLGGRVGLDGGVGGRGPDQLVREPVQVGLKLCGGAFDLVLVVQRGSVVGEITGQQQERLLESGDGLTLLRGLPRS